MTERDLDAALGTVPRRWSHAVLYKSVVGAFHAGRVLPSIFFLLKVLRLDGDHREAFNGG